MSGRGVLEIREVVKAKLNKMLNTQQILLVRHDCHLNISAFILSIKAVVPDKCQPEKLAQSTGLRNITKSPRSLFLRHLGEMSGLFYCLTKYSFLKKRMCIN